MCENNTEFKNAVGPDDYFKPIQREPFALEKMDYIFSFVFLGLSIMLSFMGLFGGFGLGMSLAMILIISAVTAYFYKDIKVKTFPIVCLVLSITVNLSFTLTSNQSVKFFSFIFSVILALIWFKASIGKLSESGDVDIIGEIFSPVFMMAFPNLPVAVSSLFLKDGKRNKNIAPAILGVIISVPFLFVIIPLLMSSDEAFSGMVKMLFGNLFSGIFKLALAVLIAIFLISYCFSLKKRDLPEKNRINFEGISDVVLISFLSVISLCYLAYLFSQLAYFFSAFSGFLPDGYEFTVAKYARRGFFEMTVIASINFAIIFGTLLLSKKNNGKSCIALRGLDTFVGVFTLLIIATALSKMGLYIKSFGMTQLRIGTTAFMIGLGIVFISLIIRLYNSKTRVLRTAIICFATILTILGTLNINRIIANYNYTAYKNEWLSNIDIAELYELGDEGIPYIIELAKSENLEMADLSEQYLYNALCDGDYEIYVEADFEGYEIKTNKKTKIGSFSVPYSKANRMICEYVEENTLFIEEQYYRFYAG